MRIEQAECPDRLGYFDDGKESILEHLEKWLGYVPPIVSFVDLEGQEEWTTYRCWETSEEDQTLILQMPDQMSVKQSLLWMGMGMALSFRPDEFDYEEVDGTWYIRLWWD